MNAWRDGTGYRWDEHQPSPREAGRLAAAVAGCLLLGLLFLLGLFAWGCAPLLP